MASSDDVTTFDGNAIWDYGAGFIKAYTQDLETKRRLTKVVGAELSGRYFNVPNGKRKERAWDFIVPKSRLSTVVRILSRDDKAAKVDNF